jgi:hypothetical protein
MHDNWFRLASGRDVSLEQFHVRVSERGFLMGSPERIRAEVLGRLPKEAAQRYGSMGFLLREPPPGRLPAYTFFAELVSLRPLSPSSDCSALVLCWFGNTLAQSIRALIGSELETLDWEKHAKDANY